MEENNKQLLIRDICARLPYGVYVKFEQYNEPLCLSVKDALAIYNGGEIINDIQYLYLRPMSSMTEGEYKEFCKISGLYKKEEGNYFSNHLSELGNSIITERVMVRTIDWLNSHQFDYRGLIEKGLALEAPKDMYKNE